MKKKILFMCALACILVACGAKGKNTTTSSTPSGSMLDDPANSINKIDENAQNNTEDEITIEGSTYTKEGDGYELIMAEALDEENGGGYYCQVDGLGFTTAKAEGDGYVFEVYAQDGATGKLTYDMDNKTMTLEIDGEMAKYAGVYNKK